MAAHVWATTLLYGDMANVSAQIMKNMHVPFKDLARCSNGKRGWELQGTHTLKQMYHPRCQSRLWVLRKSNTIEARVHKR